MGWLRGSALNSGEFAGVGVFVVVGVVIVIGAYLIKECSSDRAAHY